MYKNFVWIVLTCRKYFMEVRWVAFIWQPEFALSEEKPYCFVGMIFNMDTSSHKNVHVDISVYL